MAKNPNGGNNGGGYADFRPEPGGEPEKQEGEPKHEAAASPEGGTEDDGVVKMTPDGLRDDSVPEVAQRRIKLRAIAQNSKSSPDVREAREMQLYTQRVVQYLSTIQGSSQREAHQAALDAVGKTQRDWGDILHLVKDRRMSDLKLQAAVAKRHVVATDSVIQQVLASQKQTSDQILALMSGIQGMMERIAPPLAITEDGKKDEAKGGK